MTNKHLQVYMSAASKKEADNILDSLLKKKLISGGLISNGPSRFWWKGKITKQIILIFHLLQLRKIKKQ